MRNKFVLYIGIIISPIVFYGQGALTICNSFDTNIIYLNIDTLGIWKIGQPTKPVFDSSYTGINSIVTDLDSLYPANDTSVFYVVFKSHWGGIPNYLGIYSPLEIEFNHRFITDSITDYGSIEMSLDNGNTWYDILSSQHNANWGPNEPYANEHYFEGTGDTLFDSLAVFGNSNGWVHSKFSKNIEQIIWNGNIYPDSIIVRFSFITDSVGGNEGWQIDNLCMSMDFISGLYEIQNTKDLLIYPNPSTGNFTISIENFVSEKMQITIYNVLGEAVYVSKPEYVNGKYTKEITLGTVAKGMYMVKINSAEKLYHSKIIVE